MRKREITDRQTVDQAMIRNLRQSFDRAAHRKMSGAENVQRIDLRDIGRGDGPDDGGSAREACVNVLTSRGGEFLRIIEAIAAEFFGKDDRRCRHRTGERTTPGFIDPCHDQLSEFAQLAFEGEIGHAAIQFDPKRSRNIGRVALFAKNCVAKMWPSESVTTPTPV